MLDTRRGQFWNCGSQTLGEMVEKLHCGAPEAVERLVVVANDRDRRLRLPDQFEINALL